MNKPEAAGAAEIRSLYRALCVCVFFSGISALVYEVSWFKVLSLVFGSTVYAMGMVLAAFMLGLALGSAFFGRWADKSENPLKLYAMLEAGIGLSAVIALVVLKYSTGLYLKHTSVEQPLWQLRALQFALAFIALLLPTALMGGTLPAVSRFLVRSLRTVERDIAVLYGINTLGAAAGTLLAGFTMIRVFGITATVIIACGLNLLVAGYVLLKSGKTHSNELHKDAKAESVGSQQGSLGIGQRIRLFAFTAAFFAGMSALVYEQGWTRLLISVLGGSTYSFSLILAGVLVGITVGSLAVYWHSGRRGALGLKEFAWIQLLLGVSSIVPILLFPLVPEIVSSAVQVAHGAHFWVSVFKFWTVLIFILFPASLLGASFPILVYTATHSVETEGRTLGYIYAANTAGAVAGALLGAFVLLRYFGSSWTIKSAAVINILLGACAMYFVGGRKKAAYALLLLIVPLLPFTVPQGYLDSGAAIYALHEGDAPIKKVYHAYLKEGLNATISVTSDDKGGLVLRTNGKADAGINLDMSTQLGLGYYPALLRPGAESALVIGYGSGVTVRALRDAGRLRSIECLEIEEAVMEAAPFFSVVNDNVHLDPKVSIVIEDARTYVLNTKKTYDMIISEPSNPWISSIGNLFTVEFYTEASRRLNPGGVFVQWAHLYSMFPSDIAMILNSMRQAFPETSVWLTGFGDIILIASDRPVIGQGAEGAFSALPKSVRDELKAYMNIDDFRGFTAYMLLDTSGTLALSKGARLNTDDHPVLEYSAPVALYFRDTARQNYQMLFDPLKASPPVGMTKPEYLYRRAAAAYFFDIKEPYWAEEAGGIHLDDPEALALVSGMLARKKNFEEAWRLLNRSLELEPDSSEANYLMGFALGEGEKIEDALRFFEKAAQSEPRSFQKQFKAAEVNAKSGKLEKALFYAMRAQKAPGKISDMMMGEIFISKVYSAMKKYGPAEGHLRQAIALNPYVSSLWVGLSEVQFNSGRRDEGCQSLRQALTYASDKSGTEKIRQIIKQACQS